MIVGKHYIKGYVINITADTKPEDIEWIIKKHPESKNILIDNNIENSGEKSVPKSKSRKGTK